MNNILSCLEGVRTVIIAGHTRPDGDCVGACMGLCIISGIIILRLRQMSDWNRFQKAIK